jgi:serine/threonine-protein kinase
MASNPKVLELLEVLIDSGQTPEEVCQDCPDLLAEVRRRWRAFRAVDGALDELFPDPPPSSPGTGPLPAALPEVPGYRVEAEIGRGGMGVVYKAVQLRLQRPVALKMVRAGAAARPEELARFLREVAAVAALRHPNVVQVHDAGEAAGRPYFTMELVEGGDLAGHLNGAPQPARRAAAIVAAVADAMHAAHQLGLVHRDLKPSNILLSGERGTRSAERPEEEQDGPAFPVPRSPFPK